jgi:phage-related protein
MSYVQSALSFGGYIFPAAFVLLQRDQPTSIDEVKVPMYMGTTAPVGTMGSKVLSLRGTIGGQGAVDSAGVYILNKTQAEAELNLMASYLESGYQPFGISQTPPRTIAAQKRKFTTKPRDGTDQACVDVEIELVAPDPRWIGTASASIAASGTATAGGSAPTFPKATFTGAGTPPTLKIQPAGSAGYVQVIAGYTMLAGDTLVIDCDPRNRAKAILLNGLPRLDLLGTAGATNTVGDNAFFPYLLPGANTVTMTGAAARVLQWSDAFLF